MDELIKKRDAVHFLYRVCKMWRRSTSST